MPVRSVSFLQICGFIFFTLFLNSCSTSGPGGLFGKRSPHEIYAQRLKDAGLHQTAMGSLWLKEAENSLKKPLAITVPYKETGYFAAERIQAAWFRFQAKQGEKLTITLDKKPVDGFTVYVDLLEDPLNSTRPGLLAFADITSATLTYEVDDAGSYLLRLQPELLSSGEYTLSITSGPSLAYPIKATGNNHVQSFWGAGRDGGARKHEGIDMFAPFRTPVIAAANGTISRVNETNLGGKVVWLRPDGKNYTLYYAHLDTQLVQNGQVVQVGDTLGLMGNTGNARTTPPHLHFGIYTFGGAVDPLLFVNRAVKKPADVNAPLSNLNATVRTTIRNSRFYSTVDEQAVLQTLPLQTTMLVQAASRNLYKATLPNGQTGYINSKLVNGVNNPVRNYKLPSDQPLLDQPDIAAAKKAVLSAGRTVSILGNFQNYYLVTDDDKQTGWISQ